MASFKTKTWLNLRREPVVEPRTLIATLPPGETVDKISDADVSGWWHINVPSLSTKGIVAHKHLEPAPQQPLLPAVAIPALTAVHLPLSPRVDSRRASLNARAYPINEPNPPSRVMTDPTTKADSIHRIIAWLDVERSARYEPITTATYCNIYAFDFCHLAGVYIPRVWWTSRAIAQIAAGITVPVQYWFCEFGAHFGWARVFNMNTLQDDANAGKVCTIVGQRVDLNRSGHITVVVPEGTLHAERLNGNVVRPLQSQAGRFNYRYFTGNWWSNPKKFRAFGFWVHD